MIRPPEPHHRDLVTSVAQGVTLVTLAPEQVPKGFIRELATRGVRVAFGHSMAGYEETRAAMAEGLTGFTHLFNAMRPLASREPGPIAAALEASGAYYGLIVDGAHVHPAMLRLALRGTGNAMLVTDAMPPVGGTRTHFTLHGREITAEQGKLVAKDGTLAGASLDMAAAVRNCVQLMNLSLSEALRLASAVPADFLGLGRRLGYLSPGHRADIVALNPRTVSVRAIWVAGNVH
jgi:N-acetylglucosamine-6-phosphate deacetylase